MTAAIAAVVLAGCQATPKNTTPTDDTALHLPAWARADVAAAVVEPDEDPATLVPADSRLYIRLDNLGSLLQERSDDPLVQHASDVINALHKPELWQAARERLGITMDEMIARYFGRQLVIVEHKLDDKWAVVVMSRANYEDLTALPDALEAQAWGTDQPGGPKVGPMHTFSVASDGTEMLVAIGRRWFMLTEAKHADHLRHIITSVAQHMLGVEGAVGPLASGEKFRDTISKLPADTPALMYTRNAELTERHGVTVVEQDDGSMRIDYHGQIDKLKDLTPRVEAVGGVDFGLLPAETITAATINVLYHPKDAKEFGARAESGSKLAMSVLPDLSPPLLVFLGRVPADQIEPNPGVSAPVLGLAVKLKDPDIAKKLNSIVRSIHMIVTLTEFNLIGTVFGAHSAVADGVPFTIADFGRALARRVEDPSLKRLVNLPTTAGLQRVSYGRIGDWYVVCSQEAFFRRCVEAYRDSSQRLVATPEYQRLGVAPSEGLVASSITRAGSLASLLEEVHAYWQSVRVDADAKPDEPGSRDAHTDKATPRNGKPYNPLPTDPDKPYAHIDRPLQWITDALKLRRSFSVQVWRDGDAGLIGRLRVLPSDEPRESSAKTQP